MKYRVGIDSGMFTDLACVDEEGKIKVIKASSTAKNSEKRGQTK